MFEKKTLRDCEGCFLVRFTRVKYFALVLLILILFNATIIIYCEMCVCVCVYIYSNIAYEQKNKYK